MQCPEWDVYVIGGRSVYVYQTKRGRLELAHDLELLVLDGGTDPGAGADRTGARVVGRWRSAAIQQARARARVQICWVWLDVDTAGTAPVGELAKLTKPPAHGMHAAACTHQRA
jgi:hypothetical protein